MMSQDALMANTTYTMQKIIGNGERIADCLALYDFYYYTAKRQQTNRPWATVSFCAGGLNWSRNKVQQVKKILRELGLIKDIHASGKKGKAFIQLRYITKKGTSKNLYKKLNAKSIPSFNSACVLSKQRTENVISDTDNNLDRQQKNNVVSDYSLGCRFYWGQQNLPQMLKENKYKCLKTKKNIIHYTTYNEGLSTKDNKRGGLEDHLHLTAFFAKSSLKFDTKKVKKHIDNRVVIQYNMFNYGQNNINWKERKTSGIETWTCVSGQVFRNRDTTTSSKKPAKKIDRSVFRKLKLNPTKSNKTLRTERNVQLTAITLMLLEYWNAKESLPNHKIKYKKSGKAVAKYKQSKVIQKIDDDITNILKGTFYKRQAVAKGYQLKKYSIDDIKKAIDNVALMFSPGYPGSICKNKVRFNVFFHNPHTTGDNSNPRYAYKYTHPFLYYLMHEPTLLEKEPIVTKSTEHKHLVCTFLIKLGINPEILSDRQYNKVVGNMKKAVRFVKTNVKRNTNEVVRNLPQLLCDAMESNGIDRRLDKIPLIVYCLSGELKKRLYLD